MPLDRETLERLRKRTQDKIKEINTNPIFQPIAGNYTIRLLPIAESPDIFYYEYGVHNLPGENAGAENCKGKGTCPICSIMERLSVFAQNEEVSSYLSSMEVSKKYIFKIMYRQEGEAPEVWHGPVFWKVKPGDWTGIASYIGGKYGDPTEHSFDIGLVARKKRFKGREVFDVKQVFYDMATELPPYPTTDIKLAKIMYFSNDEAIIERLKTKTALAPYIEKLEMLEEEEEGQDNTSSTSGEYYEDTSGSESYSDEEVPNEEAQEEQPQQAPPPPKKTPTLTPSSNTADAVKRARAALSKGTK